MTTLPVFALLAVDLAIFLAAIFVSDRSTQTRNTLVLSLLFFCSGMPALVYQVVWERVLFAIYGVNAESVAVIVSAFMLGLGLGALAGGKLSALFPRQAIVIFGLAELATAIFGLFSIRIFHWAAEYSAGASLQYTVVFSLALLIVPTMLMGATLPLLIEHLVRFSRDVGRSVATLYFVNTLGAATACALAATFLLRDFGQSGSVSIAALMNALVGSAAFLYGRSRKASAPEEDRATVLTVGRPVLPIGAAMLVAGLSGFIALGFEIAWFRVFALAASDRAPAFALLLSTYLAGIAAGAFVVEKVCSGRPTNSILSAIGLVMLVAGAFSVHLPALVAAFVAKGIPFLWTVPAFFLTAAMIGSVLPLACELAISPDDRAGQNASLVYVSNIAGSAAGSLAVGFFALNYFSLRQVSLQLGFASVVAGIAVGLFGARKVRTPAWAVAAAVAGVAAVLFGFRPYSLLFEKLTFGTRPEAAQPFAQVVENRYGVIAVTRGTAVFSGGVYDGNFNVDPLDDVNFVIRPYSLSSFVAAPKKILMLGLASGSWAQILANHPQLESMDLVDINPGFLQLLPQYPAVRSLLENPRVHVHIDDARRWLTAHPEARYDVMVANLTFHWRDHSSHLLSTEFLQLVRKHLSPGGVYFYNTTESDDAIATGLHVFPFGLRVFNFLAVSDSQIDVNKSRWLDILRQYRIDGKLVFDPADPRSETVLQAYMVFADSVNGPPALLGMESSASMNARLGRRLIITDDNMGLEWLNGDIRVPWR